MSDEGAGAGGPDPAALLRLLPPYWPWNLVGFACMLASDACGLIAPQLIRAVVDGGVPLGQSRRPPRLNYENMSRMYG